MNFDRIRKQMRRHVSGLLLMLVIMLAVPMLFPAVVRADTPSADSASAATGKNGWDKTGTKYYENGKLVKGKKKIDGHWYYFDKKTGEAVKNDFQVLGTGKKAKTCYYDENGWAVYGEKKIGKYWYYFNEKTGAMKVKGFQKIASAGKTCYYNAKGRRVKGEKKIGKYWYYFDKKTGAMAVNTVLEIPGKDKTCYFNKKGRRVTGSFQGTDGKWYTLNADTGAMKQTVITIDAGHQRDANLSHEPIGPGASSTKIKVAGGATGVATGKNEYELTLEVAKKLQKELKARGFKVKMTRTSHDVNISNSQRAKKANKAGSAAYIILHADSDSPSARGAHTICNTRSNRFCGSRYKENHLLADKVIKSYTKATGFKSRGVVERDDLSGLNWSKVPTAFLEMGFMSNATEDRAMANAANQVKMASGIADGIEAFLKAQS